MDMATTGLDVLVNEFKKLEVEGKGATRSQANKLLEPGSKICDMFGGKFLRCTECSEMFHDMKEMRDHLEAIAVCFGNPWRMNSVAGFLPIQPGFPALFPLEINK